MEALSESSVEQSEWVRVEDSSAPGRARGAAMAFARRLGFSEHRIGEVGIAATELGTNLHRHASQGTILVRLRRAQGEAAVELVVIDAGPGIADLKALTRDGNSSAGTLGIGLGAVTRLATWFDSHSVLGRGTVMVATFWRAAAPAPPSAVAALTRPIGGETICGDVWAQSTRGRVTTLLLADGLGHGELAAIAARKAAQTFASHRDTDSLATIMRQLDQSLHSTRGAAVAIVRLDATRAKLTFAGIGNIAAWVDDGQRRRGLPSSPGIVGNNTGKKVRELEMDLAEDTVVVLHSDGLTSKWDLDTYPGLRRRDPNLIAATLLRDAGVRHDDASVVVAKAW